MTFREARGWKSQRDVSYDKADSPITEAAGRRVRSIVGDELEATADRARPGLGQEFTQTGQALSTVMDAEKGSTKAWVQNPDTGIAAANAPGVLVRALHTMSGSAYGAVSGALSGVAATQRALSPLGVALSLSAPAARQQLVQGATGSGKGLEGVDYVVQEAQKSPEDAAKAHYLQSMTNPDYRAVTHDTE
jgi:hypothetical protein